MFIKSQIGNSARKKDEVSDVLEFYRAKIRLGDVSQKNKTTFKAHSMLPKIYHKSLWRCRSGDTHYNNPVLPDRVLHKQPSEKFAYHFCKLSPIINTNPRENIGLEYGAMLSMPVPAEPVLPFESGRSVKNEIS